MADNNDALYQSLGRLVFAIITRDTIEVQMSALTDAVAAMKARIDEDVANLRALLDAALATDAADAAEIARLTAEADTLQADIDAAIVAVGEIDPDPAFPAAPVEEPPVEPPVEPEAPTEPSN